MRKSILYMTRILAVCLFCMLGALPLSAQQRAISGTVVDETGNPLAGAFVTVTGDNARVAITVADGTFTIQAASNETLFVTYLGYRDANVPANSTNLVVTMQPDGTLLDDVVVVGYGTQRKATMTGAISAVGNKEITVTKNENVMNMISGKLPGVRIMQTSSQPGDFGAVKMDIRGMGNPLVVVDGIPRDATYFARMDANEIDQVSVLKDASAAIYGVRAANGVVLVTTKRGAPSDGKFNITMSANYGIQNFLYTPETASAADHMMLYNEKLFNSIGENYPLRRQGEFTWQQIMDYSSGRKQSTNWTDELFRKNAPQQSYNVSLDGGTDKISYFFNAGYLDQQSSLRSGSLSYNRWNFRSNVDAKITNRLKASVELSGYQGTTNQPAIGGEMYVVYKTAWIELPSLPAWLDEEKTKPAFHEDMKDTRNIAALVDDKFSGFRRKQDTSFNGTASLQYEIPGITGLTARAMYNYTYNTTDETNYLKMYKVYERNPNTGVESAYTRNEQPTVTRRADPGRNELMLFSLNYNNTFGDHSVGAFAAWEETYGFSNGFESSMPMLQNSEYPSNGEPTGHLMRQGASSESARRAFISRVNYGYKDRYLLEATLRADASSSFSKLGVWGYFPSVLAAWRISEEPWVKSRVPFIQNLKLRASWGVMGDQIGKDRQVMGYYTPGGSDNPENARFPAWIYGGKLANGVVTRPTPNPDLTWTVSKTANIGLDFDLWNGKLSGTFELFQRNRSGLYRIPEVSIPYEVGAPMPDENIESDKTFGWEILLGHRNTAGGVHYWVNAQISAAKNRWDYHLDSPARSSMENWRRSDVSGRNKDIWWVNEDEGGRFQNYDEIENHFLPITQDALPGDYWYEDWNGDGIINDGDKHPVATFNLPVFNYGISVGAAWKGVDLSMNWAGSAGVYNKYTEVFEEVAPFEGGAVLEMYKDRWHTVNPNDDPWNPNTQWIEGFYPATKHSFNTGTTGIRNTSYIRLKTLELGYTLPVEWLESISVRELRVYVSAYNLLTFTTKGMKYMDPERPGAQGSANNNGDTGLLFYNYPINRTFNFGATLKF